MQTRAELSAGIARWLAGMWQLYRSNRFLGYLAETFGINLEEPPFFDRMWIAEAETGDLDAGAIGGIITQWWVVDDAGVFGGVCPLKLRFAEDPAIFDPQPVLKFFTDGERANLGERFGPHLACRRAGRVVVTDAVVSVIDVRVIWGANR